MRIPLKAKVHQVTVLADPQSPKGRAVVVVLSIPDGAIEFRVSIAEGAEWLAQLGKVVELQAGFVLLAAPGYKAAPV